MAAEPEIRTGRHRVFALRAHLAFVTKYRHPVFAGRHPERLEEIMRDVFADFEMGLTKFNGENNHVHLLVNFPPKVGLSRLVNSLREFPPAGCAAITGGRTACYFAGSTARVPIPALQQYIEQQNRPL
jgi:putative transposase